MRTISDLLVDYSIEATVKDAHDLAALTALAQLPAEVYVPYLHTESDQDRIAACIAIRTAGLTPVPHLAARCMAGRDALDRLLSDLRERADVDTVFLIAGDIARPSGPFADSLSVIESGLIERHGFARVGIAGHPDGHPDVADEVIWQAMQAKTAALRDHGLVCQVVTQFSFDAERVVTWLGEVEARAIGANIRLGIPGPASAKTLLRYAARCGVSASASAVAKYGFSLGRLFGSAGPDAFLAKLLLGMEGLPASKVKLHLFPFGGFQEVSRWLSQAAASAEGLAQELVSAR
jgi:methylenetetrahydrofolate reductase (NADPH)